MALNVIPTLDIFLGLFILLSFFPMHIPYVSAVFGAIPSTVYFVLGVLLFLRGLLSFRSK
ncbi:MAG: hypothetical protein ABH829_04860 [archaeon]